LTQTNIDNICPSFDEIFLSHLFCSSFWPHTKYWIRARARARTRTADRGAPELGDLAPAVPIAGQRGELGRADRPQLRLFAGRQT
jgi:hypothetical protein